MKLYGRAQLGWFSGGVDMGPNYSRAPDRDVGDVARARAGSSQENGGKCCGMDEFSLSSLQMQRRESVVFFVTILRRVCDL